MREADDDMLRIAQLREELGCSSDQAARKFANRHFPHLICRIGRFVFVSRKDLREFMKSRREGGRPDPRPGGRSSVDRTTHDAAGRAASRARKRLSEQ